MIVVPHSQELRPQLPQELNLKIRGFLDARVPAALAGSIRLLGPSYTLIGISADVTPTMPGEAAVVEARVYQELNRYLHPLYGGKEGTGWDFRSTAASVADRAPHRADGRRCLRAPGSFDRRWTSVRRSGGGSR